MEIKIERSDRYVSIETDNSTYLFHRDTYNALFHAILQTPADDVVWVSCVTADMVSDPEDSGELIDELDELVERAVYDVTERYVKCLTCNTEEQVKEMVDLGHRAGYECESCNSEGIEN